MLARNAVDRSGTVTLNIARDFSRFPGGRRRVHGKHSGEEFREDWLIPRLRQASKQNEVLEIDFDGTLGYGSSFLEEAFGGAVRQLRSEFVAMSRHLGLRCSNQAILDEVQGYINDELKRLKLA